MPELFVDALRESRRKSTDVRDAAEISKRAARELWWAVHFNPDFGKVMRESHTRDLNGLCSIVDAAKDGVFTRTEIEHTERERQIADAVGIAVGKGLISLAEAIQAQPEITETTA